MPDVDPLTHRFINDAIAVCAFQENEFRQAQSRVKEEKISLGKEDEEVIEGIPPQLLNQK